MQEEDQRHLSTFKGQAVPHLATAWSGVGRHSLMYTVKTSA